MGDVAAMRAEGLKHLIREDEAAIPTGITGAAQQGSLAGAHDGHLKACMVAVDNRDPSALEEASIAMSIPAVIETVIFPLMRYVGDRYRDGDIRAGLYRGDSSE